MERRTKIVATLGPATDTPEMIDRLVQAGVNVVRLNFSHGSPEDHKNRAQMVRDAAKKRGKFVAILGDLQGPKIRISRFVESKIQLAVGDRFALDASLDKNAGNQYEVGIDYEALVDDCVAGDILLLDDGRVQLKVIEKQAKRLECEVTIGGPLSNNKGINRQGGGLSAGALTEKDMADIKTAAEIDVDYLAVSFPRSGDDMHQARQLMIEAGGDAGLIAKIERAETVSSVENIDEIVKASDGVMVARGDLGVEIGDAELIGIQKLIIARARTLDKTVITATQMMESMISSPMPTRAEVFDVANAVLDGTDAVMLSAETAAGEYPVETVEAMVRVIIGAERNRMSQVSKHRMDETFERIDESIAMAAMYTANHLKGVKAIISMTESGATPLLMSRIRSGLPIFAYSCHPKTQTRVALYRGVKTIPFDSAEMAHASVNQVAVQKLVDRGDVVEGDLVLITKGDYVNAQGGTNTLKIVRVGATIQ
ncbi:MAG: pyruvate kinase [Oceanospirillaceae bacterium]|nr:pyruvate kinase [Oceanospirillaceae bacterium]